MLISIFLFLAANRLNAQSVGPDGSFNYQIPIKLPPGTKGMAPQLSLVYNSNSGNGMMGMGWSLDGLPAITRDTSYPINYDGNDTYIGPNGRLVKISENIYHSQYESFSKFEMVGSKGDGPAYWIETRPDGTKYYYGYNDSSQNSQIVANDRVYNNQGCIRAWALSKVEDIIGNYYTIEYFQDSGEFYPKRIVYTYNKNVSVSKLRSIEFLYNNRSDFAPVYTFGTKIETKNLLSSVIIKSDVVDYWIFKTGNQVRKYILQYEQSGFIKLNRLKKIYEYGSDDTIIQPYVFDWQDGGEKISYVGENTNPGTHAFWNAVIDSPVYKGKVFTGDFNGDGKTDLILIYRDPTSPSVSIYHWFADSNGLLSYAGMSTNPGTHAFWNYVIDSFSYKGMAFTGDFNGDGKTDLMMIYRDPTSPTVSIYHWFAGEDGLLSYAGMSNNPGVHANWNLVMNDPTYRGAAYTGDFNGDGKTDLMMIYRENNTEKPDEPVTIYHWNAGNDGLLTYAGMSTKPGVNASWNPLMYVHLKFKSFTGDYNGDGKLDFMVVYRDALLPTVSIYHWFADSNGILTYAGESSNPGTHAFWNTVVDSPTYRGKAFADDYNGDGKTDLMMIYRDNTSPSVSIYHWVAGPDGMLSFAGESTNPGTHAFWDTVIDSPVYQGIPFTGDFNGDGKTDLLMVYRDSGSPVISTYHWLADSNGILSFAGESTNPGTHAFWNGVIGSSVYKGIPFTGDFNGDGKTDLLLVYRDPNSPTVSINQWNAEKSEFQYNYENIYAGW